MNERQTHRGTRFLRALPVLAVFALTGCTSAGGPDTVPPPALPAETGNAAADDALWLRYFAAVDDARVRDPAEISKDLLPLLPGTGELSWKDGRVLMVTWTKAAHFSDRPYARGDRFPLYGDTWLTAVPVVRDFCSSYAGADLATRLKQLLGLPPDSTHDAFLEVWVRPRDIFRPCPDPEITDSECELSVPLLDPRQRPGGTGEPPWYCPGPGVAPFQQQGQFVVVQQSHLDWMCRNWRASFTNEDPKKNYPWTALGYTYDWGHPADPEGPSEYVAVAGAPVVFERLVPTDVYCGRSATE